MKQPDTLWAYELAYHLRLGPRGPGGFTRLLLSVAVEQTLPGLSRLHSRPWSKVPPGCALRRRPPRDGESIRQQHLAPRHPDTGRGKVKLRYCSSSSGYSFEEGAHSASPNRPRTYRSRAASVLNHPSGVEIRPISLTFDLATENDL